MTNTSCAVVAWDSAKTESSKFLLVSIRLKNSTNLLDGTLVVIELLLKLTEHVKICIAFAKVD